MPFFQTGDRRIRYEDGGRLGLPLASLPGVGLILARSVNWPTAVINAIWKISRTTSVCWHHE